MIKDKAPRTHVFNPDLPSNFASRTMVALLNRAEVKFQPGTTTIEKLDGGLSFLGSLVMVVPTIAVTGAQIPFNAMREGLRRDTRNS